MRNWSDIEAEAQDPAAPLFLHREGVERALAVWDDGLDIGGLAAMVRMQQAVIFQTERTILVLTILIDQRDDSRKGRILAVVGNRDDAYDLGEAAILFCRDHGCETVEAVSRRGWTRDKRTRQQGWRTRAVLLERRIK